MRKTRTRRRSSPVIFILIIALLGVLLYDSNTRLVSDGFTLSYQNLPRAFEGYKIVQLSDLHAASFGSGNSQLLGAVEKEHPNIIVITGDLVTYNDSPAVIDTVIGPLVKALCRIAPVYYVTGNHEWEYPELRTLLKTLDNAGVTVLRNDYVRLKAGDQQIVLAGVDDPNGPRDKKTPEALIGEIRAAEGDPFIVLLEHRNTFLHRFAALDIDLVLCGHAHGGQIRLPGIGGLIDTTRALFPDYTSGIYMEGSTKMLVSRGIGNGTGVPRFLNNPEVAVVTLRTAA
jgi:predicted MPP superfamily phosphohydrolase